VCHPIYSLCAAIYKVLLNIIHHPTLPPLSHNHNHDDGTADIENDDVFANCEWSQTEIIGRSNFSDNHFINTTPSSGKSILHTSDNTTTPLSHPTNTNDINTDNSGVNIKKKSYPAMLKLISGSLVGDSNYSEIYAKLDLDNESVMQQSSLRSSEPATNECIVPTLSQIARKVALVEGKVLDEKQYTVYQSICCTFMIGLIKDGGDTSTWLGKCLSQTLTGSSTSTTNTNDLIEQLEARGGMVQLLMFLTGAAGSGKSTGIMVAQRFCFEFCQAVGNLWSDSSFLFTAYTGSAASLFGGITIVSHAHLKRKGPLTEDEIREWESVRILVIDEISFMNDNELKLLDNRLREVGDRCKVFGGFSIIFAGDFRQLEPIMSEDSDLLFSSNSSRHWENTINATVILDNEHRFKDCPEFGKLLKRMWEGDLTKEDRELINTRVIGHNGLTLPSSFEGRDACFACPSNKERNAISKGNFKKHVMTTHPNVNGNELPPDDTLIIEADIKSSSSKRSKQKVDNVLRRRILTSCGDADVKVGTKKIDPLLCLRIGAYICCVIDNSHLKERVPRGNGTVCRVSSIKLKEGSQRRWKNHYGKKVWTICAKDVEWLECELANKPQKLVDQEQDIDKVKKQIKRLAKKIKSPKTDMKEKQKMKKTKSRLIEQLKTMEKKLGNDLEGIRFRMKAENFSPRVRVKTHHMAPAIEFTCKMTQFPINLNDAVTGHKLQGMSKDVVIITSWPNGLFKNWEYVVLSRVRTLEGLYLFEPIDLEKSFKPSTELQRYLRVAKTKEKNFFAMIKRRKAKLGI